MRNETNVTAKQVHKRKIFTKVTKTVFLLLLLLITILYFILYAINNGDNFTISVDKELSNRKNIFLSEDGTVEKLQRELTADSYDYMDNISINWISENVDTEATGSHNGNNYLAYTFYVVNTGKDTINYWYQIDIDDTIRDVDKAIRIMIYHNGDKTVYGKLNEKTKEPEETTDKGFFSTDIAVLEERKAFAPNEKDRITVVVWVEGDDPDCNNDLIGGGIKMHMDIREESINGTQ